MVGQTVSLAGTKKASFWKRFLAMMIDNFIIGFSTLIVMRILGTPEVFVNSITYISFNLYGTLMEHYRYSTFGKNLMKLKVITLHGDRPSMQQSLYRNFGKLVSGIPLFYGFIRILAPHRRQTMHDEIAGCLVVETE